MSTTQNWPKANEKQLGWTERYPRPTEKGGHHPAVLATRQAEWDASEELRKKYAKRGDAIRAEREAREQASRAAAAADAEKKRELQRADLEATLRKRFIAAGGSESEWEAERAEIVAEHRRRATHSAESSVVARRAQGSLYSRF